MSTIAYQTTHHISKSFPRWNIRTPSTVNKKPNRSSNTPLIAKHLPTITYVTLESLPTDSTISKQTLTSNASTISEDNSHTIQNTPKQVYTFSNPPREVNPRRTSLQTNRSRPRISSAPIENSSRLASNNRKAQSAVRSLATRSHYTTTADDTIFPASTQKNEPSTPSLPNNNQIEICDSPIDRTDKQNENSLLNSIQSSHSSNDMLLDMVDSFQLAAILKAIQMEDDSKSNETSPEQESQISQANNLIKYEFVADPVRTQTLRSSPDVMKPDEESFGELTFGTYYRHEMKSSVNAQIPNFLASIISDNNSTIGNDADLEQTFTLKLSPRDTNKRPSYFDNGQQLESTIDNEKIQLFYDATLKRFYDPNTGEYYELVSA